MAGEGDSGQFVSLKRDPPRGRERGGQLESVKLRKDRRLMDGSLLWGKQEQKFWSCWLLIHLLLGYSCENSTPFLQWLFMSQSSPRSMKLIDTFPNERWHTQPRQGRLMRGNLPPSNFQSRRRRRRLKHKSSVPIPIPASIPHCRGSYPTTQRACVCRRLFPQIAPAPTDFNDRTIGLEKVCFGDGGMTKQAW